VAAALDHAHRHGVVHRDVKPENILLGEDGHALLADFGIAWSAAARSAPGDPAPDATGPDARAPVRTGAGLVVGTPAYMSPEQSVGGARLDGASDQYSLACVAYEMLAGVPAFAGAPDEIALRRFAGGLPALPARGRPLPARAAAALRRALAVPTRERFPTTTAFAEALAAGLGAGGRARPAAGARGGVARGGGRGAGPRGRRRGGPRPPPRRDSGRGDRRGDGRGGRGPGRRPGGGRRRAGGARRAAVREPRRPGRHVLRRRPGRRGPRKLAALGGLRVIAGASSRAYRGSAKPPARIARELGVRYLLVGRVLWRRAADGTGRVRVDPELVDVTGGPAPAVRWQQGFDAPLADVFRVRATSPRAWPSASRWRSPPPTSRALGARPTRSLDAYDAYLRAQAAARLGGGSTQGQRQAAELLAEAVRLDPTFALAWAALAHAQAFLYEADPAAPAGVRASARRAAERALALAPGLPEVRAGVGSYYLWVAGEPARALAELTAAHGRAPYNPLLIARLGSAEYALGRVADAVAHYEEAARLDPRDHMTLGYLAAYLTELRRYPEARAAADRALALDSAVLINRVDRALVELADGDVEAARRVLRGGRADAVALARVMGAESYGEAWALDPADQRLVRERGLRAFGADRAAGSLVLAQLFALAGDAAGARAYGDSAAAALAARLAAPHRSPAAAALDRADHALALAYAGRHAAARAEAARAAAAAPLGPGQPPLARLVHHRAAYAYALAGDAERAVDRLAPLLAGPYVLSPGWLRVDPHFAALRGDPRFARLAAGR
jgi:Tfp pilus assembly protein PilF